MSAQALPLPATAAGRGVLRRLAASETRRYARHPLFVIGVLLCLLGLRPDAREASFANPIVPAAALGVLGLVAMASMTRDAAALRRAAGAPPVPERVQTAALVLACLLPFAVGLLWYGWNVRLYHVNPPPPDGFPFGPVTEGWRLAVLFGEGPMAALGGPLLGVVIGRWWPRRGVAPMVAVLLVAFVIAFQGLVAPLRPVRHVSPWTYFGGPFGVKGDPERMLLMSGSPQWWVGYLVCLCGLAVVAALWHDPRARTPRLRAVGAVLLAAAVVACVLAMVTGIDHTMVNPLGSP
ncbi:hypothetical protein [Actinomadura chibensis]|uniref:Uncharacterized protein n=1 Tax=Actinomadura chibensis TaxID=392828 RepID=A0A5D0NM48_9ACTN|nr:hypothetical protein [Actinomadura chibensis]TYB45532.1 hypothetical protein FXF69_19060 [Actinomadura chibensis]